MPYSIMKIKVWQRTEQHKWSIHWPAVSTTQTMHTCCNQTFYTCVKSVSVDKELSSLVNSCTA